MADSTAVPKYWLYATDPRHGYGCVLHHRGLLTWADARARYPIVVANGTGLVYSVVRADG